MLSPDSPIESVSFQITGHKGWDDVLVLYKTGNREWIQVKHSREGRTITLGSFVGEQQDGKSLLASLFDAWVATGLSPERDTCVVFTNRGAGEMTGRSASGVLRPPLLDFFEWMQKELGKVVEIGSCTPPPEWKEAWQEWLSRLEHGSATDRLGFLKSFKVRVAQEDLPALEKQLLR